MIALINIMKSNAKKILLFWMWDKCSWRQNGK